MTDYRTFMDRARAGEYDNLDAAINAEVERWHQGTGHIYPGLHRHLGMTSVEYGAWVIAPDLLPKIVDGSFAREAGGGMALLPPLNDLPSVLATPPETTTCRIDKSVPSDTVIDLAARRPTPGTVWHVSTVQCIACGHQHVATQPMPEWAAAPVPAQCPKCRGEHTCLPMHSPPKRCNDDVATPWEGPEP